MAQYGDQYGNKRGQYDEYGNPIHQTDDYGNPVHHGGSTGDYGTTGAYGTHGGGAMGTTGPYPPGTDVGREHGKEHHGLGGMLHCSGSSGSSSSEDDGQGGRRKKGLKEKIKGETA